MKIGYLLEGSEEIRKPPFNGPANHVRQIVKELLLRGHQVRLLAVLDGSVWVSDDLENFFPVDPVSLDRGFERLVERVIRKTQTILKLTYWGYFDSLRFAQACQRELDGFDIFLERFTWMRYGGLLASRKMNLPWVVEYNGNPLADLEAKGTDPSGLQRVISIRLTNWVLKQADHVIATGDGWRASCQNDWRLPSGKISVIENGTEILQFLPREKLQVFQELDSTQPVRLVYLGGFYPWHGIQILLQAVSKVLSQSVQIQLTLIGSGDGLRDAQIMAEALEITEKVTFLGSLTAADYGLILANSDIGVSPYCGWKEYSGLKLFDYKAAGLACIASGENGQPRTIMHGETGWIVPPCDVEELSTALIKLSTDHALRRKLGQNARLDAEKQHGWNHTTDKVEALLIKMNAKKGKI